MASVYDCSDLSYVVYQPQVEAEPQTHRRASLFVRLELTITVQLHHLRHYCSTGLFTEVDHADPLFFQETLRFNNYILKNPNRAYHILGSMLRRLHINPHSHTSVACIDAIIKHGLRMGNWNHYKGRTVAPLYAEFWGTFVEHVDYEDEEGISIGRALAESEAEFERSNYGMVPAKESSVKKMLKRVRVEDGELEKGGERIKRRRAKSENCVICLEELKAGSAASRMPCSHTFHGDCIVNWLKQSHYCPVCRFEMPATEN